MQHETWLFPIVVSVMGLLQGWALFGLNQALTELRIIIARIETIRAAQATQGERLTGLEVQVAELSKRGRP